jgi:hypothetical protein
MIAAAPIIEKGMREVDGSTAEGKGVGVIEDA